MKNFLKYTLALLLGAARVSAADSTELQAALTAAQQLAKDGKFTEALEKHVWYHGNSRNTSHGGVRLSFAMADWKNLADQFPPAKEKLFQLREEAEQAVLAGRGGFIEFTEIAAIDRTYDQEKKSYELFRKLAEASPETAKNCYYGARDLLAKQKDYTLFLKFGPPLEQQFHMLERNWKSDAQYAKANPTTNYDFQKSSLRYVLQLIEVLVGTGQLEKAVELQKKALEFTQDKSLETAVEDAKKKVQEKP